MKNCASLFIGEHNFKAFCLSGSDADDFIRKVISIDIIRKKEELYFYVKGKGFLYSMVRLMVGTMLEVGSGRLTIEQVKNALENGNKQFVGQKAEPQGLYLYDVEY
jgi:tRNA pseudouridine38-40 synthase